MRSHSISAGLENNYASFWHHLVFFLKDKYTHRSTTRILRHLDRTQWLSPDSLRQLQWERLEILIRHAYENVPYYHDLFRSLKLSPADFRDFDDLRKIPLLDKNIIRQNLNRLRARNFNGYQTLFRTSGSTGSPLIFPSNSDTTSYSLANAIRGKSWWKLRVGDGELKFWGISTPFENTLKGKLVSLAKQLKDRLLSSMHVSPFDTSRDTLLHYYRILMKRNPRLIFGYGVAIYVFAEFIMNNSLSLGDYRPEVIIYTSETLYPAQKAMIEKVFGCPLVCEYGSVEMGIIAYECSEQNLHLSDETIYAEVVESEKKGPPEGHGEIVLTHLTNFGFPFIRYNQGDIGWISSEQCPCGRGLRVLGGFAGRANDLIQKPNGEYIHAELFDYAMRYQPGVYRYRVVEEASGHIRIILETDIQISESRKDSLRNTLQSYIGSDFQIDIEVTQKIPNDPSGKFRWVISQQSKRYA